MDNGTRCDAHPVKRLTAKVVVRKVRFFINQLSLPTFSLKVFYLGPQVLLGWASGAGEAPHKLPS